MSNVIDFLMTHKWEIALVYIIGAMITFILVFLFFRYVERAEDEEREVVRYEDTEELRKWTQNIIAFTIGVFCAVMWVIILVLLFGAMIHYLVTEKIPKLMGQNDDESETEE